MRAAQRAGPWGGEVSYTLPLESDFLPFPCTPHSPCLTSMLSHLSKENAPLDLPLPAPFPLHFSPVCPDWSPSPVPLPPHMRHRRQPHPLSASDMPMTTCPTAAR